MSRRYVIVNADDFGQGSAVNRGIIEAYERGIVTSASLMTRRPAAPEAAAYAREHHALDVGIHLDVGEWFCRNGEWELLYHVVDLDDPTAVERELRRQLEEFRQLVGREPTHLDSHQHVHRKEPMRSVASQIAAELGVPLRDAGEIRYYGAFYGQTADGEPYPEGISLEAMHAVIGELPPGWSEIGCHPGHGHDVPGMYRSERQQELAVLCDPSLRVLLAAEDVTLSSFAAYLGSTNR